MIWKTQTQIILRIRRKLKKTTKDVTNNENKNRNRTEEKKQESKSLSDDEVKQTLKRFEGVKTELDEKTNEIVGKLLLDEKDEKVSADKSTYFKLFNMTGSFIVVFVMVTITIFKYLEAYKGTIT